jgi:2-polyprenyl-3-methyl-5-hydroxy-6-metoxy-1,4-benzoquinol methylase
MSEVQKLKLNEIAQNYHQSKVVPDKHIEELGLEYTLNWILENIAVGTSVLEMGYGDGIVTEGLVKNKVALTVVEGAKSLCDELEKKFGSHGLQIFHSLFEDFEPSEKFDTVIASHVLEHVDDPFSALKKVHDWLKPGGRVIIIVPNKESIHRQLAVLMGVQEKLDTLSPRDLVVGHQRVYSLEELKREVSAADFVIEQEKGFFLKVLPNSMMLNFSIPLLKALHEIETLIPKNLLANIGIIAKKP